MTLPTGLVACPECGVVAREPYPPNASLYFYQYRECGSVIGPQPGDGCVFRSFGRARECRLGPAQLEDASGWIDGYRRVWERRLDRFGAYVEERR